MTGQRASASLAAGSVVSGLLAYLLFVLVTRGLGAADAAPVSVLWTVWALVGAGFTFPVQHWITRSIAAGEEGAVRRAARPVSLVVTGIALALGLLAWMVRDDLFRRGDAWFPVMVGLITVGSAVIGVNRGVLGGRGRFASVAVSLVAENGARCVLVAALLAAGVQDPVAHGLCLVAGQLVVLCWPSSLRLRGTGSPSTSSGPLSFLGAAATAQLVSQVVLTGAPVVLALAQGAPHDVTALFAALALFRAPYIVALGTVPQLTARLTPVSVAGNAEALRRLTWQLVALAVAGAGLAAVVGAVAGPPVLRLVFGDSVDIAGVHAAVMAAGCTIAVANLVLMVVTLAEGRPALSARAWVVGLAVGAGSFALLQVTLEPLGATVGCFLAAEAAALVGLAVVAVRRRA